MDIDNTLESEINNLNYNDYCELKKKNKELYNNLNKQLNEMNNLQERYNTLSYNFKVSLKTHSKKGSIFKHHINDLNKVIEYLRSSESHRIKSLNKLKNENKKQNIEIINLKHTIKQMEEEYNEMINTIYENRNKFI